MKLANLILDFKKKYSLNNADIARLMGVSKATVGRWAKGEVQGMQSETIKKLSKVVGYDVKNVLGKDVITFKRPSLGEAKGGYDMFLESDFEGEEEVNYDEFKKGDFFLRVKGNSMMGDGIVEGSLVYVEKTNILNNGQIGVIQIGDEVTIKRVIYKDGTIILEASNPAFDNRYFSKKEIEELPVKILGRVLFAKKEY